MVFMKESKAARYIKSLGLEKSHNAIKRTTGANTFSMSSEVEIFTTAHGIVRGYVQKYSKDYRVTLYILREDGTAQFFYNDYQGINGSTKQPFETVKGYADKFAAEEDYILIVETSPWRFEIVTQK